MTDEALTADKRGAKSLKWIKGKIEEYLRTDRPVTAVLEVTLLTTKPPDADVPTRNKIRSEMYTYIAQNMSQQTQVAHGLEIILAFEQVEEGLVHFITRSGYVDNLKSAYIKKRLGRIQAELRAKYKAWDVRLNFLLTKPLEYVSDDMARLIVSAEAERKAQPPANSQPVVDSSQVRPAASVDVAMHAQPEVIWADEDEDEFADMLIPPVDRI